MQTLYSLAIFATSIISLSIPQLSSHFSFAILGQISSSCTVFDRSPQTYAAVNTVVITTVLPSYWYTGLQLLQLVETNKKEG